MTDEAKQRQRRQWLHLAIIAGLIFGGLFMMDELNSGNSTATSTSSQPKVAMDGPVDQDRLSDVWLEKAQDQLERSQQERDDLKEQLAQLKAQQREQDESKKKVADESEVTQLQKQLKAMKQRLHKQNQGDEKQGKPSRHKAPSRQEPPLQTRPTKQAQRGGHGFPGRLPAHAQHRPSPSSHQTADQSPGMRTVQLNLTQPDHDDDDSDPTIDNYVPSGTHVKAVVIGGADTSAGVDNQANPTPVLLRLIEDGRAPNGHSTELRNCRLTAAAIGSVSSERSQLRLERLSCTRDDGTVIERPVKGTVFGPSGHNGVRGRHVSRNQRMLFNAGLSGTLSGLGDSLSQQFSTISQSPLGSTQTVQGEDVFAHGLAKGADTGMSKLADYYIKRAEQYHPVIELNAGTRVDVVFLKGFELRHQPQSKPNQAAQSQRSQPTTARGRAQQALAAMNQSGREQP